MQEYTAYVIALWKGRRERERAGGGGGGRGLERSEHSFGVAGTYVNIRKMRNQLIAYHTALGGGSGTIVGA
jgi:hypothetical protein